MYERTYNKIFIIQNFLSLDMPFKILVEISIFWVPHHKLNDIFIYKKKLGYDNKV